MTPEQRKQHAEVMNRDIVAKIYALVSERDNSVLSTVIFGEGLLN